MILERESVLIRGRSAAVASPSERVRNRNGNTPGNRGFFDVGESGAKLLKRSGA
jgi:hypothetical protein